MFRIAIFLIFILSTFCYPQQDSTKNVFCDDSLNSGLDSIKIENTVIKYKIISNYKSVNVGKNNKYIYNLNIILPDSDSNTKKAYIEKILFSLPLKTGNYEITVSKTCYSLRTLYQAMKWLPEQEKRLADGTILRLENPNAHYVEPKEPEKEKETE